MSIEPDLHPTQRLKSGSDMATAFQVTMVPPPWNASGSTEKENGAERS